MLYFSVHSIAVWKMEKVRLRVQWRDGTFLPVLFRTDYLGRDLVKMLKFVCGPCQKLTISFNDVTIADHACLSAYGVKNDDIIHANITSKDPMKMVKALDRVVREAARVSDMRIDRTADTVLTETSSDDEQPSVVLPAPTVVPGRTDVRADALPNFWMDNESSSDPTFEIPQYSTRCEAIAFFASQGRTWVW